jgi:hypothetical protein
MTEKNASNFVECEVRKLFKGFLHAGKVVKHCLRALNKYVLLRPRRSWLKDSGRDGTGRDGTGPGGGGGGAV